VLSSIALVMTAGVYGLVAGIVKLDDAGLYLTQRSGASAWVGFLRRLGAGILWAAPWLMKALSVAGTAAMFLVGGGILTHGIGWLHHAIEAVAVQAGAVSGIGPALATLTPPALDAVVGVLAGALVLLAVTLVNRVAGKR
jgi:predicted DNA repair protein MutK